MYGEQAGAHVTESTPCLPKATKPSRRLHAERQWEALTNLHPTATLVILRLAGVYGPARSALHTIATGRFRPSQTDYFFVSRVHVDDVVTAMLLLIQRSTNPESRLVRETISNNRRVVINVADDVPATRAHVFAFAFHLLSRCASPIISPQYNSSPQSLNVSQRTRDRTSKKVDNIRLKRFLFSKLDFPSYISGLTTIAMEEFGLQNVNE